MEMPDVAAVMGRRLTDGQSLPEGKPQGVQESCSSPLFSSFLKLYLILLFETGSLCSPE